VALVNEMRQGLAYARNAGINASHGDIIVATDDDVRMPADWLEKLVTPFAQNDVMIVTGNVLPAEIETEAQYRFEAYGGLGRGFEPKRVDGAWFEKFRLQSVPTWTLGATANAAFRATIFDHPDIGLMDEALGPGLPSGVGEDTYLFYKVLKAGYTLVYEPTAYVMHSHRRTAKALRRQLYNYSKGHVAYQLTTWLRDHDWRALFHAYGQLPLWNAKRLVKWALRRDDYPLTLILLEMWGNVLGPIVLWRSRQRVRRQGRSQRYVPRTGAVRYSANIEQNETGAAGSRSLRP
jgi:GT2 family glycosyltransferase